MLAKIKEEQGLIAEAADLMQEVAVSFSSSTFQLSWKSFFIYFIVYQCALIVIMNYRWRHLVLWQKLRKLLSFLNK